MDIYVQLQKIEEKQNKVLSLLENLSNNNVAKQNKVYDLTDLENILHTSRRTILKWKSEGKLAFSQIGKKLYITDDELSKFLADNKEGGIYEH